MSPETKPKLIGLIVVGLLVVAGTGTVIWMNRDEASVDTSSTGTSSPISSPTDSDSTSTPSTANYKDGTYSADGAYRSPGGNEEIGVTLTITGDTISAVSINARATSGDAQQYQKQFKDGISEVVVGKKVNEISVSRVSGSSLTSAGFNNALEAIKSEAQV